MNGRSSIARPTRIERQAYKWVMKMLDDPTRHAAALERWLTKNPEHRAVYKRVAVEVGYASDAAVQLPSLRIAATEAARRPNWSRPRYLILSAGLTAAAAVLVILGWRATSTELKPTSASPMVAERLITHGTDKTVRLADGSEVTLFGASAATVRYSDDERAIDLNSGRARFAVEHDAARPFVVYVRGGKVTAVGTLFEVDAGPRVLVRLVSGRVIVTVPNNEGSVTKRDVVLTSGQRVSFEPSPASGPPKPMAIQAPTRDRDIKSFDDVPVSEVVEQVNSRSPVKIVLMDSTIGQEKIFAELDVGNVDGVARKLATILGLTIDRSTSGELRLTRDH